MGHHTGPLPRRRWITDDHGTRAEYKLCLRCRRWLPATVEHWMVRGSARVLRSPCRDCHRAVNREWWQRKASTPEGREHLRENGRISYRLRRKAAGVPVPEVPESTYHARYGKPWTKLHRVPPEQVAVLAAELDRVLAIGADTIDQIAARARVPERRILQVRTDHQASLWTVDRLCLAIGMPLVELEFPATSTKRPPGALPGSTGGR